jgi:hypothetical protein
MARTQRKIATEETRSMKHWMVGLLSMAGLAAGYSSAPEREFVLNDAFPTLKGEFLDGKPAVLPDAGAGHITLVLLGLTYDSRFQVEAWGKKFRQQFGADPDVTFFEVPMIGAAGKMGNGSSTAGCAGARPSRITNT